VPERLTVFVGDAGSLHGIESVAVLDPVDVGANATRIVHELPGPTALVQPLLVIRNCEACVPPRVGVDTTRLQLPVFDTVIDREDDTVFRVMLPKEIEVGDTEIRGGV
jgi:hypothetical protein